MLAQIKPFLQRLNTSSIESILTEHIPHPRLDIIQMPHSSTYTWETGRVNTYFAYFCLLGRIPLHKYMRSGFTYVASRL